MSKKHPCAWLFVEGNREKLQDYLAILRRGRLEELETLPTDFLMEWKSASSGSGVFHYAANNAQNPEVVAPFLKERGVDPNAISLKGSPVIAHALNRKKSETLDWCRALEEVGARVDLMPCRGVSLLVAGVQANRAELVQWAVERGAIRTYPDDYPFKFHPVPDEHKIFHSHPERNQLDGIQALETLLPPAQVDLDRQLLVSVRHGCFDWAEVFIAQGADWCAKTIGGDTGLHALADLMGPRRRSQDERHLDWVRKFCAAGVEVSAVNATGMTALDLLRYEWDMDASQFMDRVHAGAAEYLSSKTQSASSNLQRPRL